MKLNFNLYLFLLIGAVIFIFSCEKNSSISTADDTPGNYSNKQLENKLDSVNRFLDLDQIESALRLNNQLINLAKSYKSVYFLGKAYGISGYIKMNKDEDDSVFYYLNLSKENFLKLNDSVNVSKCLTNMAIIQANQADYSGSELTSIEALKYLKDDENTTFLSSIYNCLAISSFSLQNYDEAIYWYKLALKSTDDTYSRQLYKNNLAVAHLHNKNYSVAISELISLQTQYDLTENPELQAKVMDNLAYAKWKQNPYLKPESEFLEALAIRETHHDTRGKIASHSHLSEYYAVTSSEKSLLHALNMYENASLVNSPDDRLEALQKLISAEKPQKAKEYAIVYTQLNDSLVKVRNTAKDQFAKIRYDTERNRQENEVLRAQTSSQQLEIERRKMYGILTISLLVLISGGALALYRIQKIKNQKKLNEEIHTTENKIAKKIHDDLANNVYQLMSFVENNKDIISDEKKNHILEKLDGIYRLSRNISRENSPVETGDKYPEELLTLISSYKNEKTNVVLSGFNEAIWKNVNKETKIQFYKVLQELLTNMKKHSKASLVVLSFKFEKGKLNFFYTDNGIGIAENQFIAKNGIRITENRIEKINGTISFANKPDKGLKVNISIPL